MYTLDFCKMYRFKMYELMSLEKTNKHQGTTTHFSLGEILYALSAHSPSLLCQMVCLTVTLEDLASEGPAACGFSWHTSLSISQFNPCSLWYMLAAKPSLFIHSSTGEDSLRDSRCGLLGKKLQSMNCSVVL